MFTPPSKWQTGIYIKGKSSEGFPFCFAWVPGRFLKVYFFLPMTAGVSSQDGNIMRFWLWRLGVPRLPEQDCRIKLPLAKAWRFVETQECVSTAFRQINCR